MAYPFLFLVYQLRDNGQNKDLPSHFGVPMGPAKKSTFFLQKLRYDSRSLSNGVLAQLVERLNGIEEVRGSNPLGSRLL
jgi:hypothetical protein